MWRVWAPSRTQVSSDLTVPYFPKNHLNKKKARFNRPLIGVEGGGYMLLARANAKVDHGRAVIVNGLVRILKPDPHPGYDAAEGYAGFHGMKSGYAGPTVIQFNRGSKFEL